MNNNMIIYSVLLSVFFGISSASAQMLQDSTYVPQITITSLNGFGPYVIGTERTNYFMVYDLPQHTSSITFRFIDVYGNQIDPAYTVTGEDMQSAYWQFESDTINFTLSPQLNISVQYQTDSIANYYIPYIVYPDTVQIAATNGWGPFVTNNYQRTDTSWHNVPACENNFKTWQLPPETDTVIFRIYDADSTVIDSSVTIAGNGQYLDSAFYENVRMDQLPLTAKYIEAANYCDGGPSSGVSKSHELTIIPQKPKLTCITEQGTYHDTLPEFTQDQLFGQALMVDTNKYSLIQNGPGIWNTDNIYTGPYSFDIINGSFTIEAWFQFNWDEILNNSGNMIIMSVDSLWFLELVHNYTNSTILNFHSMAGGTDFILSSTDLYPIDHANEWHHIAYTYYPDYHVHVYLNGEPINQSNTYVYTQNFIYIANYIPYLQNMRTKPLVVGSVLESGYPLRIIKTIDELRIWNIARSNVEIKNNYRKPVLQSEDMIGYWDFDGRRNRLQTVSDNSYYNNSGILKSGAYYIPESLETQSITDTLIVTSSVANTDSIKFTFLDQNNIILFTQTEYTGKQCSLIYDISTLSYKTSKLEICEYYPGCPDDGFVTGFDMRIFPPTPIATPIYNWITYYQSDGPNDVLKNTILVSGLPDYANKITCGLKKNNEYYDTVTYYRNSVPYLYSLTLNGIDNYVETANEIAMPTQGFIQLMFKSSSSNGGKIIGFSDTQNGINSTKNNLEILMETNGTIRAVIHINNIPYSLYGEHAYNDGEWHSLEYIFGELSANLKIDGTLVDHSTMGYLENQNGYWLIGRNHANKTTGYKSLAEYFNGSVANINILSAGQGENLYKFDDGMGEIVHDSKGNNHGSLKGSLQKWLKLSDEVSFITWEGNMAHLPVGSYNFIAKIYYSGGPAEGVSYNLGIINIDEPLVNQYFSYNFENGIGFFNEAVMLINKINMKTDYNLQGTFGWVKNFVRCIFLTPDHEVVDDQIYTYTLPNTPFFFPFDMGDAPPGSYISFQFGFIDIYNDTLPQSTFAIPIYINQMASPTVTGDFGPFEQAIAPGTMVHSNTFSIATDHLDDLKKVTGKFYDSNGILLQENDAVKLNDTIWALTSEMQSLSPPESYLKIEYFLGQFNEPALIEGPYKITIQKTRPGWFDAVPDTSFHDIQQNGDVVTFSVSTALGGQVSKVKDLTIPEGVPMFGGSAFNMNRSNLFANLKYTISTHKLEIDGSPELEETLFAMKIGPPEIVDFDFGYTSNASYFLDDNNDLFATHNFSSNYNLTWSIKRLVENPAVKIAEIYKKYKLDKWKFTGFVNITANFTVSGELGYSSRTHFGVDSITGKWGSYGTLEITADSTKTEKYENSASYHFVSLDMDLELSLGLTFGGGVVDGYAAIAGCPLVGTGKSYIDLPQPDSKWFWMTGFQFYFRVYLTALWSWYETNLYGPRMIYRHSFGTDMLDCFPPYIEKKIDLAKSDSSFVNKFTQVSPVGWFTKMPQPLPQHSITLKDSHRLFTWLEPGESYGERNLQARYLNVDTGNFEHVFTLANNRNAIQKPQADLMGDHLAIYTWMQSRHSPETFLNSKSEDVIERLAQSQDIWFALYDMNTDSVILSAPVDDDMLTFSSGRVEANPQISVLSNDRALIVWQVADLATNTSGLWYLLLSNNNGIWETTEPAPFAEPDGTQTQIKLASPEENLTVAVWINSEPDSFLRNRILSSVFDGSIWSEPVELMPSDSIIHYNSIDIDFENNFGGMVYTTYSADLASEYEESLWMVNWNVSEKRWNLEEQRLLFADNTNSVQLPKITINNEGKTVVAFKLGQEGIPVADKRISQVELMTGDITDLQGIWKHVSANELVCDTTKQVDDFDIAYAGNDTLMLLSHEFIMAATNISYTPTNGIRFGDPVMNLVLRSFRINESGDVEDINESLYYPPEPIEIIHHKDIVMEQNKPNPCDNSTVIAFYMPENANVRLEIFNLNGLLVSTLIDQELKANSYEMEINTKTLRSGTYIYRFIAGDVVISKKMMVAH